jgi:hypothetical protein
MPPNSQYMVRQTIARLETSTISTLLRVLDQAGEWRTRSSKWLVHTMYGERWFAPHGSLTRSAALHVRAHDVEEDVVER